MINKNSVRIYMGFPGDSDSRESTCKAGDPGSIPGPGRSPGEGNGDPLQCSGLENPMDRGAWWATVHGITKSWPRLSDEHTTKQRSCLYISQWTTESIAKQKPLDVFREENHLPTCDYLSADLFCSNNGSHERMDWYQSSVYPESIPVEIIF